MQAFGYPFASGDTFFVLRKIGKSDWGPSLASEAQKA